MTGTPGIVITNNQQFRNQFHLLDSTSTISCRLRLSPGEEHILVDLQQRNVKLFPSATAQLASRSKAHQARIFSEFMLPNTRVIYDTNGLLEATTYYQQLNIGELVVKQDRKNGGLGIHRFRDIEDVYNSSAFGNLPFPLIIQPLQPEFRDIRVIVIGSYIEAYERVNPWNFRHNLHCGGHAKPIESTERMLNLCRRVMTRGGFPYAHIDLMKTNDSLHLIEINLKGGLRGARISSREYREKIQALHDQLIAEAENG